ncbi:hypothetical protein OC835_005455 [Tilletia horrida]|nr:hypothetical protein OC835_005455 [Tilletia horrida]KAK0557974.1 hypothetical protein OC844_005436 [Tilletia horrida]
MSATSTLQTAWDASIERLGSSTLAAPGPTSVALAENLRQVDVFLTPTHANQCAWKDGFESIRSQIDAISARDCLDNALLRYLQRCEHNFAACARPLLDKIVQAAPTVPVEVVVEQSLVELHVLMKAWRAPLEAHALGSDARAADFDSLFGRLLRATLTRDHLQVISEIMRRLINRVARRATVTPGAFVPSSRIWIDLGIADIAFTSLVSWSKVHLNRRIRALAASDFSAFQDDELDDPLVRDVLRGGPFLHRVLPTIQTLLRDTYAPVIRDWLQYFTQNAYRCRTFGGDLEGIVGGLYLAALETLSAVRSKQVFDIVMDFPASQAAMLDLKECLHLPDSRETVIAELASSIRQRLLHPGAQTSGIILTYLRMVSALRLIDESGVILSRTAPALRRYLRLRPDTVSAIVTALIGTDPDFESLREELRKESADHLRGTGAAAAAAAARRRKGKEGIKGSAGAGRGAQGHGGAEPAGGDDEGDAEEFGHFDPEHWKNPNWQPRPVDAGSNFNSTTANDIVNMLVSIFDEEAHFVTALERSTATELIKVKDYAPDKEVSSGPLFCPDDPKIADIPCHRTIFWQYHNNLILKKRFGEVKLARCDVMLNDFPTSRRIDYNVHERITAARKRARMAASRVYHHHSQPSPPELSPALDALHPLIVSRQFWPSLEEGLTHEQANGAPGAGTGAMAGVGSGAAAGGPGAVANRPKLGMMKMPGQLGQALDEYALAFAQVKSTRKVHWLGGLGSVDVELEMEDGRVVQEECSPAQAAVVEIAAAKAAESLPVTIEELVVQLEADKAVVAAALQFWTAKGVLRELDGLPGTFEVVENAE